MAEQAEPLVDAPAELPVDEADASEEEVRGGRRWRRWRSRRSWRLTRMMTATCNAGGRKLAMPDRLNHPSPPRAWPPELLLTSKPLLFEKPKLSMNRNPKSVVLVVYPTRLTPLLHELNPTRLDSRLAPSTRLDSRQKGSGTQA